jgi:hypothetical protein
MQFDIAYRQTQLELRILELEDTVATLSQLARTLQSALTETTLAATDWATRAGGLVLALPSTAPRHLWPTLATTVHPEGSGTATCHPTACPGCATDTPPPTASP